MPKTRQKSHYRKAGAILRKLREEKKLGIKTAAPRAKVTYSFLSKVENGHKVPSESLVRRLCNVYGADTDDILPLFGQLPSDIRDIILENKKEAFEILRNAYSLNPAKSADTSKK